MSVSYFPAAPVRFEDLFDGRLAKHRLVEELTPETTATERALKDIEGNVLWIYRHPDGSCSATRYGGNDVFRILSALQQETQTSWDREDELDEETEDDEVGDDEDANHPD